MYRETSSASADETAISISAVPEAMYDLRLRALEGSEISLKSREEGVAGTSSEEKNIPSHIYSYEKRTEANCAR